MISEFYLSDAERNFLIDNKDLIDSDKWDIFIEKLDELFWINDDVDFEGLLQFIYFDCKVDFLQEIDYIPESMFQDCNKLNKFIVPSNIEWIKEFAFYGSSLSGIVIPKSVRSIGSFAFKECENLKFIDISNVENVAEGLFLGTNLEEIYLNKKLEKSPLLDDILHKMDIDKEKTKIYYK